MHHFLFLCEGTFCPYRCGAKHILKYHLRGKLYATLIFLYISKPQQKQNRKHHRHLGNKKTYMQMHIQAEITKRPYKEISTQFFIRQ